MKKLLLAVLAVLGALSAPANAQQPQALIVATCGTPPISYVAGTYGILTMDTTGKLCDSATGGGGGGGAITAAAGSYSAGAFVAGAAVDGWDLTQGTIGDAAAAIGSTGTISAKLRQISAQLATLQTAVNAAVPGLNATNCATNSYSTGQTNPLNADLNGALCGDIYYWGGVALGAMANYGTSPGAVKVPGVNASMMQGTTAVVAEPCQTGTKTYATINGISTATTTLLKLNPGSGVSIYVCHLFVETSVAEGISIVDGTTAGTCGAGIDALIGDTTANTSNAGVQLTAGSGYSLGSGGYAITATAANKDLCIITGSTGIVRGSMTLVIK